MSSTSNPRATTTTTPISGHGNAAADHYERLGWLIFGAVGCVIGWVFTHQLKVHQRPIPVQSVLVGGDEEFFVKDLSFDLKRPEGGDTVSTIMTYILAGLIPILLQMALAWKYGPRTDIFDTVVVYLVTMGVSLLATEPVKWYVSWLRPNFYEMCEPDTDATFTVCQSHEPEGEARHSFPSGHSVTAFGGLTVLTYYLNFRYGVPAFLRSMRRSRRQAMAKKSPTTTIQQGDENGHQVQTEGHSNSVIAKDKRLLNRHRIISIVALILPQGLAIFISASRIRDNRHFPADVVAGALIGGITALFVAPLWWFEDDGYNDDNGEIE